MKYNSWILRIYHYIFIVHAVVNKIVQSESYNDRYWYHVEISTNFSIKEMLEHIIDDVLASNGL